MVRSWFSARLEAKQEAEELYGEPNRAPNAHYHTEQPQPGRTTRVQNEARAESRVSFEGSREDHPQDTGALAHAFQQLQHPSDKAPQDIFPRTEYTSLAIEAPVGSAYAAVSSRQRPSSAVPLHHHAVPPAPRRPSSAHSSARTGGASRRPMSARYREPSYETDLERVRPASARPVLQERPASSWQADSAPRFNPPSRRSTPSGLSMYEAHGRKTRKERKRPQSARTPPAGKTEDLKYDEANSTIAEDIYNILGLSEDTAPARVARKWAAQDEEEEQSEEFELRVVRLEKALGLGRINKSAEQDLWEVSPATTPPISPNNVFFGDVPADAQPLLSSSMDPQHLPSVPESAAHSLATTPLSPQSRASATSPQLSAPSSPKVAPESPTPVGGANTEDKATAEALEELNRLDPSRVQGWGDTGRRGSSSAVSQSAISIMAVGASKFESNASGPILSLADQARAKGHFAEVDIVDSSSDAEEGDGIKPSEVAAITVRNIRKKRRSFSEGLQPPPMASVDACSPVVKATADALDFVHPGDAHAEAISAALRAHHQDAIQAADKTKRPQKDAFTHRVDQSRRYRASELVGKALDKHLPEPLPMIGAALAILEAEVGAVRSAYFQAVPGAQILIRHTRAQCQRKHKAAPADVDADEDMRVPYGRGAVGMAAECMRAVASAGGTMMYEEDIVMHNDGGSGFSGAQGCALAVPLISNSGVLIGVLAFAKENAAQPFGGFEEVLVEVAAVRVALSLSQCDLFRENTRNAAYKSALQQFIRFLAGEDVDGDGDVTREEIMEALAPLMRDILNADEVTVLLLDEKTQLLWGVSTREGEASVQRQPLTGLAKHVLQSGEVANECVEAEGDLHTISSTSARSVLMLKMEAGPESLGVVEFTKGEGISETDPGWANAAFNSEDQKLAEAMCLQVAETLLGSHVEEENVTGAKRWLNLQQALSFVTLDRGDAEGGAIDIDDDDNHLAYAVLSALREDFGTEECVMFLEQANPSMKNPTYERVAFSEDGNWVSRSLVPAGKGVPAYVMRTREPVSSTEAHTMQHFDPEIDRSPGVLATHTLLCVPLMDCGRAIGVLHATNKSATKGGIFTDSDQAYLEAVAMVTVAGLAACTAAETIDTLQRKCNAYLEVARQAPEASPKEFYEHTTETMRTLLQGNAAALHFLSRDKSELCTVRRVGGGDAAKSIFFSRMPGAATPDHVKLDGMKPDSEHVARRVIERGECINIPDAINHPFAAGFIQGPDDELASNNMVLIHNVLCVPIKNREGVIIGALEMNNKTGEQNSSFTPDDLVTLTELAELVSCAVQRLELHESWSKVDQRQQALTNAVNSLADHQELAVIIDNTAEVCKALVAAQGAVVCMITPDEDALVRVDYLNTEDYSRSIPLDKEKDPVCYLAEVAQSAEGSVLPVVSRNKNFDHTLDGISGSYARSAACVPLKRSDGTVMGVLECLNKNELVPHFSSVGATAFLHVGQSGSGEELHGGPELAFDQEDLQVLDLVAKLTSLAMNRHQLTIEATSWQLSTNVGRRLAKIAVKGITITPDTAWILAEAFRTRVDAGYAVIYRCDLAEVEEGGITTKQMQYVKVSADGEYLLPTNDPAPGIALEVMRSKTAVVLGMEATSDKRFNSRLDLPGPIDGEVERPRVSSLACLPLLDAEASILGAVMVINKQGESIGISESSGGTGIGGFSKKDMYALREMTGIIAGAIENALDGGDRLKTLQTTEAVGEIVTEMISNLDMAQFPDVVCASLLKHLECEQAMIFIYDHHLKECAEGSLHLWGYKHLDDGKIVDTDQRQQIKTFLAERPSVVKQVAMSGHSCTVQDTSKHPDVEHLDALDKLVGYHTYNTLVLPIMLNDNIIGVVQACNRFRITQGDEYPFEEGDTEVVGQFAKMVAISTSKILNIERSNMRLETFIKQKSHEKGIILLNFVLMKLRLGSLHYALKMMCVGFESEVQGVRTDHRRNLGVQNMQMRTWMLATYLMSRLKRNREAAVIAHWRGNYSHFLWEKANTKIKALIPDNHIEMKDKIIQTESDNVANPIT